MTKIEKVMIYAEKKLVTEVTAHDFSHSVRVMKLAEYIGGKSKLKVDIEILKVAGLTHDIIDKKVTNNVDATVDELIDTLSEIGYSQEDVAHVLNIIKNMSYSTGRTPNTLEGKIVQDADRLEAIGAVAIARTFAYGGSKNRRLYEEGDDMSSIAHFYDKLLLLKDGLNTEAAKVIAKSRHEFMENYLKQFLKEWHLEDLEG